MKILIKSALLLLLVISLTGCGSDENRKKKDHDSYMTYMECRVKEIQKCKTDKCVDFLTTPSFSERTIRVKEKDLITTLCSYWLDSNMHREMIEMGTFDAYLETKKSTSQPNEEINTK